MAYIDEYKLIVLEATSDYTIIRDGGPCGNCGEEHFAYMQILDQMLCRNCWKQKVNVLLLEHILIRWNERYAGFDIAAAWCLIPPGRQTVDLPEHLKSFWVYTPDDLRETEEQYNMQIAYDPDGPLGPFSYGVDHRVPVIMAEVGESDYVVVEACKRAGETVFMIDGMHRVSKAYWEKQPIKAYILTADELEFIRTI
jgi:hypothetical protein